MADVVRVQTLSDGPRNLVVKMTNLSDGTGEVKARKVDVSELAPPATSVSIRKIGYTTDGPINLYWEADEDRLITMLEPGSQIFEYRYPGCLCNDAGTGKTGDILLSTLVSTDSVIMSAGGTRSESFHLPRETSTAMVRIPSMGNGAIHLERSKDDSTWVPMGDNLDGTDFVVAAWGTDPIDMDIADITRAVKSSDYLRFQSDTWQYYDRVFNIDYGVAASYTVILEMVKKT